MQTNVLASILGIGAVIATYQATQDEPVPGPSAPVTTLEARPPSAARRDFGHLILQVEGDANRLSVTRVTPKKSSYNRTSRPSPFSIDLLDAAGQTLGSYPLDLSMFDLRPTRAGKPLQVQGCEVRDSRVAVLANIPYFANATALRILHGGRTLGLLDSTTYEQLIAQGEVR